MNHDQWYPAEPERYTITEHASCLEIRVNGEVYCLLQRSSRLTLQDVLNSIA